MLSKREIRCANPNCGALNRVPRYSIKRIPECGKCHTRLPEPASTKLARNLYKYRGPLILAIFVGVIGWGSRDEIRETLNPAPVCTVRASPRPVRWYTAEDDVAPFTIKTASGSDYFVKLEDASTGAPIRAFLCARRFDRDPIKCRLAPSI